MKPWQLMRRFAAPGSGGSAEGALWESRINALGGSVTSGERAIAGALIAAIQGASYGSKVVYLLPFIGDGVACARVPLRDSFNVGAASSTGFVDADCTTASGLNNSSGASKYLDTGIKPSQLGASNNGGLGWWELAWGNNGVQPMGSYSWSYPPDERFVLDLRGSFQRFRWGGATNSTAGPSGSAGNGHYYGQRSSDALRRIFKDGSSLGSDGTATDAASHADEQTILVCAAKANFAGVETWAGRGGVAYLTDGTLSDSDAAAFHTLLGTYLITPTGR